MTHTYDIAATYQENYDRGPQFNSPPPAIPKTDPADFLGMKVRSRIGIAAGLLLNSKWILGYAERGFDILTYKTVRSSHRPCYDLPNWVFLEDDGQTTGPAVVTDTPPEDPRQISSAVCFGMPSMAPEVWRKDIGVAKQGLGDGQILIVSVVATPQPGWSAEEVANDFAQCAQWAAESGADVVEANFSCPNVCTAEGTIYQDAEQSAFIAQETKARIGGTPLLLKVGHFEDDVRLEKFLEAINGKADGVTLVNGISRPVLRPDGRPAFGEQYRTAGVLGRAIHGPSVTNVRTASNLVQEKRLDLALAAVGGVSSAKDMNDFREAGADAALLGSSPMYMPDIATEIKAARTSR